MIASGDRPEKTHPDEVYLSESYRCMKAMRPPADLALPPVPPTRFMEGCAFKSTMAATLGGGFGVLMGGFFFTMQPPEIDNSKTTWEQIKRSYKGFGQNCARMGRGFAKFGLIYSAVECVIERGRGSHDIANAAYAGCATGGVFGASAGPSSACLGCVGMATLSVVMEKYMMGRH